MTHQRTTIDRRLEPVDRRRPGRPGGRRAVDHPANAWAISQLAFWIGMSHGFVRREIEAGELRASLFGAEFRIHRDEVKRYCEAKQFPVPDWMQV